MIHVRLSLEQLKRLLRQVAPKLTIQQRMKLLRELARDDLSQAPRRSDDTPVERHERPAPPPPVEPPAPPAPPPEPVAAAVVSIAPAFESPPPKVEPRPEPAPQPVLELRPEPRLEPEPAVPGWTEALPPSFTESVAPPSSPTDSEAKDDASGRVAWERRLYRLFKPARAQAKHFEGAQLAELIRKSVTEVRSR